MATWPEMRAAASYFAPHPEAGAGPLPGSTSAGPCKPEGANCCASRSMRWIDGSYSVCWSRSETIPSANAGAYLKPCPEQAETTVSRLLSPTRCTTSWLFGDLV